MGLRVHRTLAIPLSAIALLAVALTAPAGATLLLMPPTTVLIVAGIALAGGIGARTLEAPNRRAADDALDLVRMDDDGGWQMARPPGGSRQDRP